MSFTNTVRWIALTTYKLIFQESLIKKRSEFNAISHKLLLIILHIYFVRIKTSAVLCIINKNILVFIHFVILKKGPTFILKGNSDLILREANLLLLKTILLLDKKLKEHSYMSDATGNTNVIIVVISTESVGKTTYKWNEKIPYSFTLELFVTTTKAIAIIPAVGVAYWKALLKRSSINLNCLWQVIQRCNAERERKYETFCFLYGACFFIASKISLAERKYNLLKDFKCSSTQKLIEFKVFWIKYKKQIANVTVMNINIAPKYIARKRTMKRTTKTNIPALFNWNWNTNAAIPYTGSRLSVVKNIAPVNSARNETFGIAERITSTRRVTRWFSNFSRYPVQFYNEFWFY